MKQQRREFVAQQILFHLLSEDEGLWRMLLREKVKIAENRQVSTQEIEEVLDPWKSMSIWSPSM